MNKLETLLINFLETINISPVFAYCFVAYSFIIGSIVFAMVIA